MHARLSRMYRGTATSTRIVAIRAKAVYGVYWSPSHRLTPIVMSSWAHRPMYGDPDRVEWGTRGDVAYVPRMRTQLVAARSVAEVLADLATGPMLASGQVTVVAGPQEESLAEMARLLAARRGHPAKIEEVIDRADPDHQLNETAPCCPA